MAAAEVVQGRGRESPALMASTSSALFASLCCAIHAHHMNLLRIRVTHISRAKSNHLGP